MSKFVSKDTPRYNKASNRKILQALLYMPAYNCFFLRTFYNFFL